MESKTAYILYSALKPAGSSQHQLNQILNLYFSSPLLPPASLLVYLCSGEKEKYLIKHPATPCRPGELASLKYLQIELDKIELKIKYEFLVCFTPTLW